MGKNLQGGSGHKKFARKSNSGGSKNNKLRVSEDAGEIYAIVTKMLGNGMFHCHCLDDTARLGHIRGKFTFKGKKRDNFVEGGKWVLIGLREWDVPSEKTSSSLTKATDKIQQCDLLEVYSDLDKQRLKETITENWQILDNNDISRDKSKYSDGAGDDQFVFATDRDIERQNLIQEMDSATAEKITLKIAENDEQQDNDDEVNVDDI
jgi:initiation factor 1A